MKKQFLLIVYRIIEKVGRMIKQIEFYSYKYYKICLTAGGFFEMFLYLMLSVL